MQICPKIIIVFMPRLKIFLTFATDRDLCCNHFRTQRNFLLVCIRYDGFGGLGVACSHLVPTFAGSNPAEAVGILGRKKSSARLPSEGK